jgi:hypothetical protein
MAPTQPRWLQLVQRLERAIGAPVESAVRSDGYFDALAQAHRLRTRLTGYVETLQQEWLHLFNLPAGTDVRRLREQLARMERELARIAKELEELDGRESRDAEGDGPQPRRSR